MAPVGLENPPYVVGITPSFLIPRGIYIFLVPLSTTLSFLQIIKVRGYKIVVRHLPHETHHVEAVLKLLETQNEKTNW